MAPVWSVAPHPDATDRVGPGMFRERDIRPFGGVITPPSRPLVPARVQDWVDEVNGAGFGNDRAEPLPEESPGCTAASRRSTRSLTATGAQDGCS
jgi:cell filamentation protein, protein adenylyltransferase